MEIKIPELSLTALIGISGSGKSSFARKHFLPTEVLSSDNYRALVSDDENNQEATSDAFETLYFIGAKRLKRGRFTVVDATNIQPEARQKIIQLAREHDVIPTAIVLDVPEKICRERNKSRMDRNFSSHVIERQSSQLRRSLKNLKKEGFRHIYILHSLEEIDSVKITREQLWNNKKDEHGPFDIIGDIHGCYDELMMLLQKLGYQVIRKDAKDNFGYHISHPEGRKVVFLGDLVDRGPNSPEVLRVVMSMVNDKTAYCTPGNHDDKLKRKLEGRDVQINHGLAETLKQLENESEEFKQKIREFVFSLVSHYIFDDGKLVVSHAGLKEEFQGRGSTRVRDFCLYGETTGETDEFGLPLRYNWAQEYRGKAMVVYGHTAVPEPEWLNNTIDIDTGCVFGNKLTALRYPEKELISINALKQYYDPIRPLDYNKQKSLTAQQEYDDLLHIEDVSGKKIVNTQLQPNITIREENSIAALEVISRFTVHPKWLMYLPPTMSPSETSSLPDYLEYPLEAFEYYKNRGVSSVICEEKHMGSRAILVICKNSETVEKRFGLKTDELGKCFTRTGRNFFTDKKIEKEFLNKIHNALTKSNFWEEFQTTWVCLDAELLPWSFKALPLIKNQYAAVGSSASHSLTELLKIFHESGLQNPKLQEIERSFAERKEMIEKFIAAYENYCWEVKSIKDLKLSPFHILATEGKTYFDRDHLWHLAQIDKICQADEEILRATQFFQVDLNKGKSIETGVKWWKKLTDQGNEGMVIKPLQFITKEKKGLIQPAIKCRGREYLRIIYGPEYLRKENLIRLKQRSLGMKRSLALREFALGVEALERFVKKEPLRKVHECVFGVLALESEAVDARL